jgi:hypothetical protein
MQLLVDIVTATILAHQLVEELFAVLLCKLRMRVILKPSQ